MTSDRTPNISLTRVLGIGFSVALAFGNTVGVGILRLPGTVAAALGDSRLVIAAWVIGGIYATLGAISVAELASMMPSAGGFYVYAKRILGQRFGFTVGWNDWIVNCVTIAYASLTAVDFLRVLAPGFGGLGSFPALAVLGLFTGLQWIGIRIGGAVQNTISVTVGVMLLALIVGCFMIHPVASTTATLQHATSPAGAAILSVGLIAAFASSLRSIIVTYDGWYGGIYMAEETVNASRSVPRAMVGCALLLTALFTLINVGFLHALPLADLAKSKLPAADVAGMLFPWGGSIFVTVVSLLTIFGLINAVLLVTPRIIYAVSRDGLLSARASEVDKGGTPRVALALTSGCVALLVLSGTLEQLVAVAAVIFVLNYMSAYVAVFVLRIREPQAERPFNALGFPLSTGVVLAGSVVFLVLTIMEDPKSAGIAAVLMSLSVPAYWWITRRKSTAGA